MDSRSALPPFKQEFLETCISSKILTFGTFTLKSGRVSPYFFNAGAFSTARLLSSLASAYANAIHNHPSIFNSFDVIFGPAYKGIPLATLTATKLYELDPAKYGDIGYAFNRKEAKDHGEGGNIVGSSLKGKRVLIVDDVITAGTAIREAVEIIKAADGQLTGIVVALDRQEKMVVKPGGQDTGRSAIQDVQKALGVEVVAILTLGDLIVGVSGEEEKTKMKEYRAQYGALEDA
ncbi:hypothetical protein RUND412_004144 [Rhizina undulata]